jgi:hypothetical protein
LTRTLEHFSRDLGDDCRSHVECLSGNCQQGSCVPGPPPSANTGCGVFSGQSASGLTWLGLGLLLLWRHRWLRDYREIGAGPDH